MTKPLTWTRLTGAACEVAHISAEFAQAGASGGVGEYVGGCAGSVRLIVRFDIERQKLTSAVQLPEKHWLKTSMAPLMVTSLGEALIPPTVV